MFVFVAKIEAITQNEIQSCDKVSKPLLVVVVVVVVVVIQFCLPYSLTDTRSETTKRNRFPEN